MADATESFYDVLGVPRNASPDEIRSAYKKQALATHPDRHSTATEAERRNAEHRFRSVSNAYEVLKDPESRRLYDIHGVWPPPSAPRTSSRREERPRYEQPQRYDPFVDPFAHFFSEPFDLFESIFGDYRRPGSYSSRRGRDPFDSMYRIRDMMADVEREMFSFPSRSLHYGFDPMPSGNNRSPVQWASQSTMVSMVNGVTHRIDKRRDPNGNEHVTRTYPDGHEVYTLNGIEQQRPAQGYLPPPGPAPYSSRGRAPPTPPPSYHSSSGSHHSGRRHRDRINSGPVIPADAELSPQAGSRRWWHRNH
ncbi:hypothetical protein C8F01DRAFT_1248796 [Mycena amicta]|nr:hypothetical protein C8F01DRAFT_1248796 [Mycena amicta]